MKKACKIMMIIAIIFNIVMPFVVYYNFVVPLKEQQYSADLFTMTVTGKSNSIGSFGSYICRFDMGITNKSPYDITSLKGIMTVKNPYGQELMLIDVKLNESVVAGDNYDFSISVYPSVDSSTTHAELWNASYDDLKIYFRITSITFQGQDPRYYDGGDILIKSNVNWNDIFTMKSDSNGEIVITGLAYNVGDCSKITIPNQINGNKIVGIGDYAFSSSRCTSLTSIIIPNSVTSIGKGAFAGCTGLTSITIPDSVASIGDYTFNGCTSLTSITIPDSVTSIGDSFERCTGLTSITIPYGVTSVSNGAFYGCTGLTSIKVDPKNSTYTSQDAFGNEINGIIIIKDKILTIGCKNTKIPNGVTRIGSEAFYECTGLTSITIPDSVTGIDIDAFRGCTNLTSIIIPKGVTYIDAWAFNDCTGLTSITIPDSVTTIYSGAFQWCAGLTSIAIPRQCY